MHTFTGLVETLQDAIFLFEACRHGYLKRVQRRLNESEKRAFIQPGRVFVWDEEEAQVRRWTDSRVWSPSRRFLERFLTYFEIDAKSSNLIGANCDTTASVPCCPGPVVKKKGGLSKRCLSVHTLDGRHLHLVAYYRGKDLDTDEKGAPLLRPAAHPLLAPVASQILTYEGFRQYPDLWQAWPAQVAPPSKLSPYDDAPHGTPDVSYRPRIHNGLQNNGVQDLQAQQHKQQVASFKAHPYDYRNPLTGPGNYAPHQHPDPRYHVYSTPYPHPQQQPSPAPSAYGRHPDPSYHIYVQYARPLQPQPTMDLDPRYALPAHADGGGVNTSPAALESAQDIVRVAPAYTAIPNSHPINVNGSRNLYGQPRGDKTLRTEWERNPPPFLLPADPEQVSPSDAQRVPRNLGSISVDELLGRRYQYSSPQPPQTRSMEDADTVSPVQGKTFKTGRSASTAMVG